MTEKKIDQRYWIGIRQASNQIQCNVKELRHLIRQNKWKTQKTVVNNRRRTYLQKVDIKQYLKRSLITPTKETNPVVEPEANLLKIKSVLLFVENYRKSIQVHQEQNLKLSKFNYLLKISLIFLSVFFISFCLLGVSRIKELKRDTGRKEEKIEDLSGQLKDVQKQLVGALNQTIERDIQIQNLHDQLTSNKETKFSH